jgi:hypothetical protein
MAAENFALVYRIHDRWITYQQPSVTASATDCLTYLLRWRFGVKLAMRLALLLPRLNAIEPKNQRNRKITTILPFLQDIKAVFAFLLVPLSVQNLRMFNTF